MRRWVPAAAAFVLVLFAAPPAGAHAALLASTPAAGYSVSRSPAALTLVFDERVSLPSVPLHVSGAHGAVALGAVRLSNGGRWLTAAVAQHLDAGQYRVSWQVVAEDGDVVGGDYTFAVGVPAVAAAAHAVTRGLIWVSILRWLLFAALSVALGGLVGQRIAGRVMRKAAAAGARLARVDAPVAIACVAGALASVGLAVHVAGSVARLSLPALWASGAGRVSVVEVAGFAGAAALAARRTLAIWATGPLLVVVAAEGGRSHLREIDGAWGAALLAVHLAAAAIWLGALSHVIAVAWRWRPNRAAAHRVLAEYGRLALALLLLVAVTGSVEAVVALPSASALTTTGYGRLLLVKIALVLAVVGCAVAGRQRLRLTSPLRPDRAAGTSSGRAVRGERILLAGVLGVTALLVSVAVPAASGSAALAFPPPPSGPVVRLATLDGEVTVGITASDGQLEIRTSVPDPRGDGSGTSTDVSARLGSRRVALRRCGPGCFVGPAEWLRGPNAVAVTAASRSWPGGTANFRVPWPPAPDARLLRRVVAAMRATRLVTVHESVTSDTAGPPPVIATHTLSGADFVSVEPYSAAAMPVATVVGHDAGGTELAFAMPAQGYYFALRVAANDRVVGEVITTPEHLYTRTFDYPAATSR